MRFHRLSLALAAMLAGGLACVASSGATAATSDAQTASGVVRNASGLSLPLHDLYARLVDASKQAPTDAFCRAQIGYPCYSPQEIQHAYGVDTLTNAGDTGRGETIVIVDSYGSPTLASDLATFDEGYGLPAPPSLKVISPLGTVPFDPTNSDMVGWAAETTLDVEWAHAMAPGASIVLLTSPVSETEGVQGMPQFASLEQYALSHHLGQVISQSWGATEQTLFVPGGAQVFSEFENIYQEAAAEHVTVFASAGDSGSANAEQDGTTYFPYPTVIFPASSPLVTTVGGTSLHADTNGYYQYETVWNDSYDGDGSGGGGISQIFPEPSYEFGLPRSDQRELSGHLGVPDVSWNADPETSILVYLSFIPGAPGYYLIGGTSEGSPQWAGLTADIDQALGQPIGYLNPYLYELGEEGIGFHDVTVGNNAYVSGISGYSATPGWDLASGWGTPNVPSLVHGLLTLTRHGAYSFRASKQ